MSNARTPSILTLAALLAPSLLSGCPSDPVTGSDAGSDATVLDAGSDAGPQGPDICDELSLARTPMRASTGTAQGEVAGDFTVHEVGDVTFHLADAWTGCESYVFITYFPRTSGTGVWEGDALFGSLAAAGITNGPRNVQYFFMSNEEDPDARATRIGELSWDFDDVLQGLASDEERDFWRTRMHFVTDRANEIEGAPGAYLRDYSAFARTPEAIVDLGDRGRAGMPIPFVFAIDRDQRFDPGDSLAPNVGSRSNLSMVRYLPDYYNYMRDLDARLAAETAVTIVPVLADERTTTRVFTREVTLPSATAMAAFDTLEFDVGITCDARNPFACSEWDRIASISLCSDAMCTQTNELARWITPYWRRGRQHWAIDASALLGLLRDGGARTLRIELGPDWERATEWITHVAMRFSTRGGPRAMGAIPAYRGGTFDGTYNDMHAPMQFTVPAGATRVELVTILSGHGQTSGNNCAEWCDHRHVFQVGTTALPALQHGGASIGSGLGCAAHARDGAIPGQLGNWAPTRAYWCPGLPVPATRTDITSLVTPGTETTLSYSGNYRGNAPAGGDIALSSYVVWYGP